MFRNFISVLFVGYVATNVRGRTEFEINEFIDLCIANDATHKIEVAETALTELYKCLRIIPRDYNRMSSVERSRSACLVANEHASCFLVFFRDASSCLPEGMTRDLKKMFPVWIKYICDNSLEILTVTSVRHQLGYCLEDIKRDILTKYGFSLSAWFSVSAKVFCKFTDQFTTCFGRILRDYHPYHLLSFDDLRRETLDACNYSPAEPEHGYVAGEGREHIDFGINKFTDLCIANNATDKIGEAKTALTEIGNCMKNIQPTFDPTDKSSVQKSACPVAKNFERCFLDFFKGASSCLPQGITRDLEKMFPIGIKYICDNPLELLTLFAVSPKLGDCVDVMKKDILTKHGSSTKALFAVSEKEFCGLTDRFTECVENVLKNMPDSAQKLQSFGKLRKKTLEACNNSNVAVLQHGVIHLSLALLFVHLFYTKY